MKVTFALSAIAALAATASASGPKPQQALIPWKQLPECIRVCAGSQLAIYEPIDEDDRALMCRWDAWEKVTKVIWVYHGMNECLRERCSIVDNKLIMNGEWKAKFCPPR